MVFQEPKVEFIKLDLADTIATSDGSQSQVGQCDGYVNSTEMCSGGADWNY